MWNGKKKMSGWKYAKKRAVKIMQVCRVEGHRSKMVGWQQFFSFSESAFKSLRCSYRINRRKKKNKNYRRKKKIKFLFLKVFFLEFAEFHED